MRNGRSGLLSVGLALILELHAGRSVGADPVTLVANRNDVSFSVQMGRQRFDIKSVVPLAAQGSNRFEWQFDAARLLEALKAEFGVSERQVGFSELCARMPASNASYEIKTCKKLGALESAETYYFNLYAASEEQVTPQDIYIIDSKCVVIGRDNQALC